MKYQKKDSMLHRTDPRTKLLYLFFLMAFAVYSRTPFTTGLLLLLSLSLFKLSGLSLKSFFSEARVLMAFLALLFLFHLSRASPLHALTSTLFLFDIFLLAAVFIQTTNPSDLSHSLVNWKVPYELAFLFSLTLRFVPVIQAEIVEVRAAQASRCHRLRYPWDTIPLLLPVLHKLFKRALDISISLETKAFSSDRTFYRTPRLNTTDYLLLAALFASAAFLLL